MKTHKYEPFTTRDGSKACSKCHGTPDSPIHQIGGWYERLQAMIDPDQQTWDLSDKDVEAIAMALAVIGELKSACFAALDGMDAGLINGNEKTVQMLKLAVRVK